jgi:hypothetical protein
MKLARLVVIAAVLLGAAVLLTGCKDDRTRISSILGNPDGFVDREVLIGGTVTKTYAADLVITEAGAYQVDDGTGRIWVIATSGVPREGETVALKGTVAGGLKIGGESLGAILRETDRRVR